MPVQLHLAAFCFLQAIALAPNLAISCPNVPSPHDERQLLQVSWRGALRKAPQQHRDQPASASLQGTQSAPPMAAETTRTMPRNRRSWDAKDRKLYAVTSVETWLRRPSTKRTHASKDGVARKLAQPLRRSLRRACYRTLSEKMPLPQTVPC